MRNRRMLRFKPFISTFLIIAIFLSFGGCKKENISAEKTPTSTIEVEQTSIAIVDANDAISQLAGIEDSCGYENALSELSEKNTFVTDGDKYYRLQQNYKGIPVYGRSVVCATDESGNVTSITGNVVDVDTLTDLTSTITTEIVCDSIDDYLRHEMGYASFSYSIPVPTKENLCIYNMGSDGYSHLAHCLNINGLEFIIDAHSGEVLSCRVTLNDVDGYLASDQEQNNGFPVELTEDGTYMLLDAERRIVVHDLGKKSSKEFDNLKNKSTPIVSNDLFFGNTSDENCYETAVRLYFNLANIHDFLGISCGYQGGWLFGFINDGYSFGENACGGKFGEIDGDFAGSLSVGYVTGVDDLDVIAHEYAHVMSWQTVGWCGDNTETNAINEAISDIYGELYETYANNWDSPDWVITGDNIELKRNICAPNDSYYAANINDSSFLGKLAKGEEYYYSTVISHAAYLMWNGGSDGNEAKRISTKDLSKLWYRTMLMMPSDCNFAECRTIVELAAQSMGLTQDQITCISEAFDSVGIYDSSAVDFELASNATLSVYDTDLNLYGDYILQIAGTKTVLKDGIVLEDDIRNKYNLSSQFTTEKHYETRYINSSEAIPLDLCSGRYTIRIIDNQGNGNSISFTIRMGAHDGLDNLEVFTDFRLLNAGNQNYTDFQSVIKTVQNSINYNGYSSSLKEYCRGDFFEIDGRNALVLMYYVLNGSDLTPGYYVGLWAENDNGTISCLTDQFVEETGDPDDAYVTVNVRRIDGKMYLNSYVRTTKNSTDISKNQYYLIGDELVLEYDLHSEAPFVSMGDGLIQHDDSKSIYYLNQEQIDQSTFYSTQDKLNVRTYILGINPNWSEGRPPEGYTFEELLAQLPVGTTSNDSDMDNSLTTELELSEDAAQAIVDVYVPFCQSLSDTYTSSDGSVANLHFCSVVELTPDIPNLVVRYLNPYAGSPVEFYEAWLIYGIENGDVVEQFCYENYSPTRKEIELIYAGKSGYLLREIQTIAGAIENPTTILYPEDTTAEITYNDYWTIMWPDEENILRVWNTQEDYVDISLTESMNQITNAGKNDLSQYIATDVKNFSNMFIDLVVDKYSDGTQMYSNSYLFFDEDHNDKVYSISLNGESDFTICGLYYGMPFNEAYGVLTKSNFTTREDREGYLMVEGDGFLLSISAFYREGETLKIGDHVSSVTIMYR